MRTTPLAGLRVTPTDGACVRSFDLTHTSTALCRSSHQIVIKELVGLTAGAYRSLWTFISKHDLVGKVTWSNAPPDDPALDLFMEPRLLHAVDRPGIMFRVVDVPNALLGRGYSGGAGSVTLRVVEDTLAPWNAGWWRLSVAEGGEPSVEQLSEADAAGEEVLTFDAIRQLGLLFVVSTPPLLLWHDSCRQRNGRAGRADGKRPRVEGACDRAVGGVARGGPAFRDADAAPLPRPFLSAAAGGAVRGGQAFRDAGAAPLSRPLMAAAAPNVPLSEASSGRATG